LNLSSRFVSGGNSGLQVLWEDGERVFCRGNSHGDGTTPVLAVLPAIEHPAPAVLDRLVHEYELRDELDAAWAARPLEFVREQGQAILLLQDPGGEPLERLIGPPMGLEVFLRLAIALSVALGRLHGRGLVHKDIKPTNVLVNASADQVWLTGFGIASRLPRERQAAAPPEFLEGTLAYMAPEQTGRMNRSIDSRSDLYALGVTFYQMLTGSLPFNVADPMELVHCHIARKPLPPSERLGNIPVPVSEIIMKLLAKTAEERYQTAPGVESDLRHCLSEWERKGRIDPFAPGEHDAPDRLLLPEKLYGRAREIETLLACFDRIVNNGAAELVLVSGYSGIGKSSVVNELHRVLVEPRGLFASGKFDQYRRDIPYSTLAQAFQSLVRPLLGKSDPELAGWREAFREALGPNGQLITDLVPELKLIVDDQSPVLELPPHDAQRRFQLVFRRFLAVFARPEHPLALFLDDLQWIDSSTLDLLEDLLTQPDVQHLMLIGAYRDNEVNSAHPLVRKLEAIRNAGSSVHDIVLAPLAREDLGRLIGDALHCEPERVTALAELIHEKTAGNPFFADQLISVLVEEGLLTFDYGEGRWSWDLKSIRAKGYTDNVADLMVGKLTRLPVKAQKALQRLACLGNSADMTTLALVHGTSEEQVHADLWEATRQEFVERLPGAYRFVHDRVQEAAYSLIPEDLRGEVHLHIGRLLAAHTPAGKREEATFEIINQLNRGVAFIAAQDESEQVAELNLLAGQRAKSSTAYASALRYVTAGAALMADDRWERRRELVFALELLRTECEFLTGALAEAEQRLTTLSTRAATTVECASVACLRADIYTALGQSSRAVGVGLDYLRHLGGEWPLHPADEDVRCEYERVNSQLASRTIEDLVQLPLMSDPASLATIDVLTKIGTPAFFTEPNLWTLTNCRRLSLSLERGNSDGSCLAYVGLGLIAAKRYGDYKAAFRFGETGFELVERLGLKRFQARIYLHFGAHLLPCARHVRTGRDLLRRAFEVANANGDLLFAGYSCATLIENLLSTGDSLVEVQREAERSLEFARKIRIGFAIESIATQLSLIRTLRGSTPQFGCLDDEQFDESLMERHFSNNPDPARPEARYWIRKLQARFFAGDYASAIEASERAQGLLWTLPSLLETAEYHFYGALSQAASCPSGVAGQRRQYVEALIAHHRQLEVLAANCPENFENRAALVGAEIARIEGRELDAERLYEHAIGSAQTNGFTHNEALAYELAARFYAARGFRQISDLYLRNARHGYLRWGAAGKVRQLEEVYPDLRQQESLPSPTSTIGAPIEHLDLATVIKVSQAVSGDIVLESLIDTLIRTAMAQAGAERALLIMSRGQEPRIEAEATTSGDTVTVRLVDETVTDRMLPESVLQYAVRSGEIVILDDAAAESPFGVDSYIRQRQARSILCLPLLNRTKLIGVLYLENNVTPRVFAPARVSVLKLLASQAAIALENAHLYRDVAERETKIRRLVDSNIIGIFVWDFEGRVFEANDAFLRMVGYDPEDLLAGSIRWTDLTPPDWRDNNARMERGKSTGRFEPFEKEYTRKDGSRVPVLIGGTTFEEGGNEGVAFVIDLTDRKRAEEKSRESELKLQQIIETVPGLVWSNGPDGVPTHINRYMLDYSGRSLEEFRHRGWEAFVHPDDLQETAEAFYQAIQTGTSYQGVMRLRRADGEFHWHHARCEPLCDRQGRVIQWYGLAVDIDERKKAEDRLRRSEAYLAEAERLNHSGSAAYNQTELLYLSEEAHRLYGFDPLQGIPSREAVWQRFHPDDVDRTNETIERAVREKRSFNNNYRILRPDGTIKDIEAINHPVFSASGELIEIVVTGIDVTERKRAEVALRDSEAKFRDYAETASDWFWEIGPDYKFTLLTENAFGPGLSQRIGTTCWDHALDVETEPEKWRLVWATLDARESFRDFVYCTMDGNGAPMYVKASGKPVFDANGEFRGYRGTGADVTAIVRGQRAEASLQTVQAELAHVSRVMTLGQLTASIAHEVNQPIGSARNYAGAALNFLDRNPPELGEVKRALDCIVAAADRAGGIIDRIRDQIKKVPPRSDRFDLNRAIEEVIGLARSMITEHGVSLQSRLANGMAPVRGDRVQLQQVVLNLILNAIEAMSTVEAGERELLISTDQSEANGTLVAVRDSGPGIDPKRLELVFEAFYSTKSGMGMGLSICRSIIAAHGGRLWAATSEPRGALFQFTLPSTEAKSSIVRPFTALESRKKTSF
jgi:PAS domain S-box-containing protein